MGTRLQSEGKGIVTVLARHYSLPCLPKLQILNQKIRRKQCEKQTSALFQIFSLTIRIFRRTPSEVTANKLLNCCLKLLVSYLCDILIKELKLVVNCNF